MQSAPDTEEGSKQGEDEDGDTDMWELEGIVDARRRAQGWFYKVDWSGDYEQSWVSERDAGGPQAIAIQQYWAGQEGTSTWEEWNADMQTRAARKRTLRVRAMHTTANTDTEQEQHMHTTANTGNEQETAMHNTPNTDNEPKTGQVQYGWMPATAVVMVMVAWGMADLCGRQGEAEQFKHAWLPEISTLIVMMAWGMAGMAGMSLILMALAGVSRWYGKRGPTAPKQVTFEDEHWTNRHEERSSRDGHDRDEGSFTRES